MFRNAAFLLITEGVTRIASIALAIVIARGIGPEGYGRYTFALAFAATASTFADFGTGRFLTRAIAHDHARASLLFGSTLVLRAVLLLLSYGIAAALLPGQPRQDVLLLALFLLVSAVQSFAFLFRSVYFGFERMEFDTATRFLERLLATAGALALVLLGFGLLGLATAFLIAALIDLLLVALLCFHFFATPDFSELRTTWWPVLRTAFPLGLFGIILTLSSNTPFYVLRASANAAAIGQFSAGVTPVLALIPVPVTIASAALPAFSRLLRSSDAEAVTAFHLLWRIFVLAGLAAAPGVVIVAPPLVELVYG
ncbi:MAG: oligosaccharide flippase family protein, partial [Chloroflexi bacterium]|nr:oligosaccharide flippase family protein [Chloroflexota bacterium]